MSENSQDFSAKDLERLIHSPAARQLMELLQGSDPEAFSAAKERAISGDYAGAATALKKIATGKEAKALISKLGGAKDG